MTDDTVTILHNPRCTKSRQALALLVERGFTPQIVEYLKNPPQIKELQALLRTLGINARQLLRSQETIYKELGLDNPNYSEDELLHFMVKHPVLIERPVICYRGKAVIGRPPEAVLNLFD